LPLTDTVVAAARAGESVRAEASPAGVSAAMATAATISIFMGARGWLRERVGDELEPRLLGEAGGRNSVPA